MTSVWSFGQTIEDFVDEAITRSSRDDTDEVAPMSRHSELAIAYSLILQLHLLDDLLSMQSVCRFCIMPSARMMSLQMTILTYELYEATSGFQKWDHRVFHNGPGFALAPDGIDQ